MGFYAFEKFFEGNVVVVTQGSKSVYRYAVLPDFYPTYVKIRIETNVLLSKSFFFADFSQSIDYSMV